MNWKTTFGQTIDKTISKLNCFDGIVMVFDASFFLVHKEGNHNEQESGSSSSGGRSGN